MDEKEILKQITAVTQQFLNGVINVSEMAHKIIDIQIEHDLIKE